MILLPVIQSAWVREPLAPEGSLQQDSFAPLGLALWVMWSAAVPVIFR